MVFGRLKDAAADLAETLRRAFSDPPCHAPAFGFPPPGAGVESLLMARVCSPAFSPEVQPQVEPVRFDGRLREEPLRLEAAPRSEEAWARWAAGAQVCGMPVFAVGAAPRVAVPPLPRQPGVRHLSCALGATRARTGLERIPAPWVRDLEADLDAPSCHGGPQVALELPVGVAPEPQAGIPRALWMRYTLQLVKATDQNIRNLDLLGVFRIPTKGVRSLRHEAASGRLLLRLGPEAAGAPKARMMVARSKTERTLVSCFLEDA